MVSLFDMHIIMNTNTQLEIAALASAVAVLSRYCPLSSRPAPPRWPWDTAVSVGDNRPVCPLGAVRQAIRFCLRQYEDMQLHKSCAICETSCTLCYALWAMRRLNINIYQ